VFNPEWDHELGTKVDGFDNPRRKAEAGPASKLEAVEREIQALPREHVLELQDWLAGFRNVVSLNLPITTGFDYDLNGNMVFDGNQAYDYDDENQLIRVTVTNTWKSEFTYDGKMRRRIRKEFSWQTSTWVLTNEVHYVYDGNLILEERDSLNAPVVTYTRGKDLSGNFEGAGGIGGLLARTDGRNTTTAFYHADRLAAR
jgi:YD repeat-containing protein